MAFRPMPGSRIGPYEVVTELGRGATATVLLAREPKLDRSVALKLLAPERAEDPDFRARFLREARIAAALEHPNIVPVYDAGEFEGLLYIAMRYVTGGDLRKALEHGAIDPDRTMRLLSQVASALDAAHAVGLVHRDVKPANVLIAEPTDARAAEHVYLADFGLAWQPVLAEARTEPGVFLGTVDYAAPEQLQGRPLDGRADGYALGALLFECLVGDPPFRRGSVMATVASHLRDQPPRPSEVRPGLPPALDAVIAQALAKSREDRFRTCTEVVEAARAALHGSIAPTVFVPRQTGVLPVPLTSLVGRERELSLIAELVTRTRLTTLTGAGGTGKSRLAIDVAHGFVDRMSVEYLDIDSLAVDAVQPTIDGVLDASVDGRGALLVLDGCDRHLDELRSAFSRFGTRQLDAHILATSREPIRVPGEQSFVVEPLGVGSETEGTDVLKTPAGQLFWERALAADPSLEPDGATARSIAAICRSLDGIPLALELAAARVRSLPITEIERRVSSSRMDLADHASSAERHRSMSSVIGGSYELLAAPEQQLFRRLGVFAGPFGLDDADAIASDPEAATDVVDLVVALVERSLVVLSRQGAGARYRLLGPISRYAAERLDESDEVDEIHARHAARFLRPLADDASSRQPYGSQEARAAIRWASDHGDDALRRLAGRAAVALGAWREAIELLMGFEQDDDDPRALEALGVALCKASSDGVTGEEYRRGQALLEKSYAVGHRPATLSALAGTYRAFDEQRAATLYGAALEQDPSDPYALGNVIELALSTGSPDDILARHDQIQAAIARCRSQIDEGTNLPWAHLDEGKFLACLGELLPSLDAYLEGARSAAAPHPITAALGSARRLGERLPSGNPFLSIERLLTLILALRFPGEVSSDRIASGRDPSPLTPPIVIVAGNSGASLHSDTVATIRRLSSAFRGFAGSLISGGTTRGISAGAGDLGAMFADATAVGYLPGSLPPGVEADADVRRYSELRTSDTSVFGPEEPLSYWADIAASQIAPSDVFMLGIGGGPLTSFEYRLAVLLGARVGLLRESGRAARALLDDARWAALPGLLELPSSPDDLRAVLEQLGIVPRPAAPRDDAEPHYVERTFMFTDIAGSTELVQVIGDRAWESLRAWHDRILREVFIANQGQEVDHAGDGFFVAFVQPRAAIACAVEIQRRLDEHRRTNGFAPSVRIGLHRTEATRSGERYGGIGVHAAARIASLANEGEILVSRSTLDGLSDVGSTDRGTVELKGIKGSVAVAEIPWH
jgi:serine/threonine-protein kinase